MEKYRLGAVLLAAILGLAAIGCSEDTGRGRYYTAQMKFTEYTAQNYFRAFDTNDAYVRASLNDVEFGSFLAHVPYKVNQNWADDEVNAWFRDPGRGAFTEGLSVAMKAYLATNEQCYIISRTGGNRIDFLVQKKK